MEHGVNVELLAVIAAGAVLWGLVSSRLEAFDVTAPIAFLVFGLVAANEPLSLIHVDTASTTVREIAEITLVLVLFTDAARVNVHALRHDLAAPVRLLTIGLPLTIGLGFLAALAVISGIDPWVALVIGAIVAPTDAALSAPILEDHTIPARVRRVLNVESGLNDGVAAPVVTFAIAGAAGTVGAVHVAAAHGLGHAIVDIVVGVLIGGGSGIAGGWLLQRATRLGWASDAFRPVAVLGIALFAYAATLLASGNGFVAAFIGGLAFGSVTTDGLAESLEMTGDAGSLGSVVVWFLFGALLVTTLGHTGWNALLYAVLSLTLVRMVPVALAFLGVSIDRATVAVVGWFGPRGLASVVFGLIAFDSLDHHDGQTVLGTVSVVVVLSVVAHGLSARPIARWYSRRMARLAPDRPEHGSVLPLPSRSFLRVRRPASPPGAT